MKRVVSVGELWLSLFLDSGMTVSSTVVIIGGGVAGCALAHALSALNCETLLLEKGELTSGSTWHAAGNVPYYMGNPNWSGLHKRSLDIYAELARQTGNDLSLHRCGSLKLAMTSAEVCNLRAFEATARALGIAFHVLSPEEIQQRAPMISMEGVKAAAWTPEDGHIDPSSLTQAFASVARERGVQINRHEEVRAIERHEPYWHIVTDKQTYQCVHLVNAAGLHAREVSSLVGHVLPAVPMERQYLVTEPLAEIEQMADEMPVLRDASAPMYARQEGQSVLLGLYDAEPVFWALDGTPRDFDQTLLQANLERVEVALSKALERLPILKTAGVQRVVNGPLMRTPDASPLVGPVNGLENYWLNTGYFAGIAQAGSCSELLARWIVDKEVPVEAPEIAPARFPAHTDQAYTINATKHAYAEELGKSAPPS